VKYLNCNCFEQGALERGLLEPVPQELERFLGWQQREPYRLQYGDHNGPQEAHPSCERAVGVDQSAAVGAQQGKSQQQEGREGVRYPEEDGAYRCFALWWWREIDKEL
jgi:hypothetical protein